MVKYIIKDLMSVFRYLPYGILAGIMMAIILSVINDGRVKKNKTLFSVKAITGLFMYIVILLFITVLSREGGRSKGIDLELFSTWGINTRNNAYVIENILLFIPFGVLGAWVFPMARSIWCCASMGLMVSLGIECLQLITGRGFFQIDDILTNTLGTVVGYLLYQCIAHKKNKLLKEEQGCR